jgi:hypothetical protein
MAAFQDAHVYRHSALDLLETHFNDARVPGFHLRPSRFAAADLDEQFENVTSGDISASEQCD